MKIGIVILDVAFELFSLFPDDGEVGEIQFQAADEHGLYLVVRLYKNSNYICDWVVLAFHVGFVGMVGEGLMNDVAGLKG